MQVIDLRKPNLRECEPGTYIITSKGHSWQLLSRDFFGETWKDVSSGLTWLPKEPGSHSHYDAMKLEIETKRLPTKKEFEQAEEHGIREVLDDINHWFWSSSVHPDVSNLAYNFYGRSGYIYYVNRSYDYNVAVRCVAK